MSQYAYAILTSRVDGLMVHIVLYHKIMNWLSPVIHQLHMALSVAQG